MMKIFILLGLIGTASTPADKLELCQQLGQVSKRILNYASDLEASDRNLQDHLIETSARLAGHCLGEKKLSKRKVENEIQSLQMIIEAMDEMGSTS